MKNRKIGLLSTSLSMAVCLFGGTFSNANKNTENLSDGAVFVRNLTQEEIDHPIYAQPFEVYDSFGKDNIKFENGDQDCSMSILGNGTNMEDVWNAYRGDGTTIAIIDTGIDYSHPDFKFADGTSKILDTSRYYFVNGTQITYNQYGVLGTSSYNFLDHVSSKNSNGVYELQYHGSNVASTAASAINGNGGCVGIAPNAKILVLKTDMNLSSINEAIKYATTQNVDVINMSLGAYEENDGVSTYLSTAINSAYNKGIIVVAAAGNENTSTHSYPACNTHVIGVGALASKAYSKASFSNFNALNETSSTTNVNVDLSAPGYVYAASETATVNNTTVTNRQHSFTNTQGTSFASPIVAGAACLWKQAHPTGTPDQFESALYAACDDIGTSGWDTTFGHGALNIKKLLFSDSAIPTSVSIKAKDNIVSGKSGDHVQLYTQTQPLNSANKAVTWSSTDSNVATVNDYSSVLTFGKKGGTATLTATSTSTGSAKGSIQVTNTTVTPVTSVKFTNKTVYLEKDDSGDITDKFPYTVLPAEANQEVVFECSNEEALIVDEYGWMTADIDATVTVTIKSAEDASIYDTCTVIIGDGGQTSGGGTTETISDSKSLSFSGSAVSGWTISPQTTYCGLYYSGKNSAATITNKNITEFLNFASSTSSSLTVYVDGICNSGTNSVNVSTINSSGTVVETASQITGKLGSGSSATNAKSVGPFTFAPDTTVTGLKIEIGSKCCVTKVTYSYSYTKVTGGGTTTPTLSSIKVSNAKTAYTVGDTFVKPTVTATYSDGSTKDVKSSATFSGFNSNTAGTQTITVSYGGKQTTYTITVSAPLPTNYTVTFNSNGGSGTMSDDTTNGNSYVVPACTFTKANYEFDKWALNSATGTKYDVGATISNISSNITLYATWNDNSSSGGGGEYKYYTGDYYAQITESQISAGGTTLITALQNLIQPKTAFGYSNIWTFNENYDKYPSNYDGTDPLTGNAYPTTNNSSKRGKMWDMYSDQTWIGSSQRCGNYSTIGDAYNREHSLPKSWFGGSESNQPGTDPNHLFNTDGKVNGMRSNYPYGEVVEDITFDGYTFSGRKATGFGILGKNSSGTVVFEPNDAYKGDFARAQMYMATAYYNWNLTQDSGGAYCFSYSGGVSTMKSYYINLLTKWSAEDPVSQKEIDRNNAVYNSTQKNRNPFIDHPTWANKIWGGTPYTWNGKTSDDETINVDGVSLDKNSLELSVGASATLTATVSPNNATNKNVTWESSDSSVATVANGNVTGVKAGTATITVKTEDGEKTATCNVTVKSSGSTGGGDSNTYKLVTSTSELVEGSKYVFASASSNAAYLTKIITTTNGNNLPQTDSTYTISSNSITIDENVLTFTLGKSDNNYTFKTDNYPGNTQYYLDPTDTTGSNYLKTSATLTNYGKFSISFSSGAAVITSTGKNSRNIIRYNSSSKIFSCYSSGQSAVYLFKQENSGSVTPEIKDITLNETSKEIDLYSDSKTFTLTPTVSFVGEIDTTVTWSTSDSSVASISSNTSANETAITVTANKVGSATITAICGEKSATCSVVITDTTNAHTLVSLSLVSSEKTIPYMSGTDGKYTVSATLTATYLDGHTEVVTPMTKNYEIDTTSLGSKEITASYGGKTATALVKVTNSGANIPTGGSGGTTSFTIGNTGVSKNTYTNFSYEDTSTGAKFGGKVSNNGGIQIKSGDSNTGIIQTASAGKVTKITISYTTIGNGFQIYGKNSAYGAASDLFDSNKQGTLIATVTSSGVAYANANQTSTMDAVTPEAVTKEVTINGDFEYVGIRSINGAVVLSEIDCEFAGSTSSGPSDGEEAQAKAWAQYMIEVTRTESACLADTDEQKLSGLKDVWSNLASEYSAMADGAKDAFFESDDLTIVEAREHYKYIINKFGENNLTNFVKDSNNNTLPANKQSSLLTNFGENNSSIILAASVALLGVTAIGLYFASKKRKED